MSKKQRQTNREEAEKDLEELDAFGFEVEKFIPSHWRITKVDHEEFKVDVWPTTKKMMSHTTWKAKKYNYLAHEIEELYKQETF